MSSGAHIKIDAAGEQVGKYIYLKQETLYITGQTLWELFADKITHPMRQIIDIMVFNFLYTHVCDQH